MGRCTLAGRRVADHGQVAAGLSTVTVVVIPVPDHESLGNAGACAVYEVCSTLSGYECPANEVGRYHGAEIRTG